MAVQNYGPHAPGLFMSHIHLESVTADATKKVGFKAPWGLKLLGFSTFARASSGTTPTLTATVLEGGVACTNACPVVADTVTEATISDDAIADEGTVTVDLDIGGTDTPTFLDVTLTFAWMRT